MKIQRKAISPVLATVILIAITLVAAVAIAGFVFNLFGNFTNTAQISVQGGVRLTTKGVLNLDLLNSGTVSASALSATVSFNSQVSSCTPTALVSIPAGSSVAFTCTFPTFNPLPAIGQQYTGQVSLSNGESALFTGLFS